MRRAEFVIDGPEHGRVSLRLEEASARVPERQLETLPILNTWIGAVGEVAAEAYGDDGAYWVRWPSLVAYQFNAVDPVTTAYPEGLGDAQGIVDLWRRSVVPLVLVARGFEALHASSVAGTRGVVLFAARSGTGKSTLARWLAARGNVQFADDVVAFQVSGAGRCTALPLPFSVRLKDGNSTRVAERSALITPDGPQTIRAVCVLARSDDHSTPPFQCESLEGATALMAIMDNLHALAPRDPKQQRRHVRAALTLTSGTPVFRVTFRAGPDALPAVVDGVAALIETHG